MELISAFQAGDAAAFTELVHRYRRQVYRVARGILRNHEQADEAAQDAFVKAYLGLARFKAESTFKTWMYRIAMNAAFDLRAREATQARARAEAEIQSKTERPQAPALRAVDDMTRDRERAAVRAAVAQLPERQRLTLNLRVQEGLKYAEIAEALGCPIGTVKANVHHAVQNLRKLLASSVAEHQRAGAGTR